MTPDNTAQTIRQKYFISKFARIQHLVTVIAISFKYKMTQIP